MDKPFKRGSSPRSHNPITGAAVSKSFYCRFTLDSEFRAACRQAQELGMSWFVLKERLCCWGTDPNHAYRFVCFWKP